jgi:hypothetical protein
MKNLFGVGIVLVLALLGLGSFWYLNPHYAPNFVRNLLPAFDIRGPQSPLSNFRPPQF